MIVIALVDEEEGYKGHPLAHWGFKLVAFLYVS